jgi:hypothetical protein
MVAELLEVPFVQVKDFYSGGTANRKTFSKVNSHKLFLLKMMIDPLCEMPYSVYNEYMTKFFKGDTGIPLVRPKFLSDQIFNKVLFGELYEVEEKTPIESRAPASGLPASFIKPSKYDSTKEMYNVALNEIVSGVLVANVIMYTGTAGYGTSIGLRGSEVQPYVQTLVRLIAEHGLKSLKLIEKYKRIVDKLAGTGLNKAKQPFMAFVMLVLWLALEEIDITALPSNTAVYAKMLVDYMNGTLYNANAIAAAKANIEAKIDNKGQAGGNDVFDVKGKGVPSNPANFEGVLFKAFDVSTGTFPPQTGVAEAVTRASGIISSGYSSYSPAGISSVMEFNSTEISYSKYDPKTQIATIERVSVGSPANRKTLWNIGKARFDTPIVRNTIFLSNLYRIIRYKLDKELKWYSPKDLINSYSALSDNLTEYYGNEGLDYPTPP